MLNVWEAIKGRRSIRKFATDDVPEAMVEQMLEAARLAPSASNRQPWRFLVVRDRIIKQEIRRICFGQMFIEEAPVVIICFGDLERYSDITTEYLRLPGSGPSARRRRCERLLPGTLYLRRDRTS